MKKWARRLLRLFLVLVVIYLVLLIPDKQTHKIMPAHGQSFAWKQDSLWNALESRFALARQEPVNTIDSTIASLFAREELIYNNMADRNTAAGDSSLQAILYNFFSLAPLVAVRAAQRDSFFSYYNKVRRLVKRQSIAWNVGNPAVRNQLYRLLYGLRTAVEEVLLQTANLAYKPAMYVTDEPSATPAASIFGITVHSGDLLVSRGGAEVSAMISRGNDYPGNFSHVAMVYVDEKGKPYLIEAHIEKGVALSTIPQYEADKKLRFMVLRPRAGLPQLKANPQLPQQAAQAAYDEAVKRHIPYDFKMNFYDSSAMFCSEVGSYAYRKKGIQLWQGVSTISSPGVVAWLQAFGVENFVTQMPSDLEYDPQLSIVAEWRDPQMLYKDHIDNAVMDVLIEKADAGEKIGYNIWQLPLIRIVKGWCMLKNVFGKEGIIPEGMSATQALKNQNFVARYQRLRKATETAAADFLKKYGYRPPYWQLLKLARAADR